MIIYYKIQGDLIMKIYVLLERKTYDDGDMIVAVSTSERKIKKKF